MCWIIGSEESGLSSLVSELHSADVYVSAQEESHIHTISLSTFDDMECGAK